MTRAERDANDFARQITDMAWELQALRDALAHKDKVIQRLLRKVRAGEARHGSEQG